MNKVFYIINREYAVRVRKRTFWILTFLIPVFYALLIGFSVMLSKNPGLEKQKVMIVDYSGLFKDSFIPAENIDFQYSDEGTDQKLIKLLEQEDNAHVLVIPKMSIDKPEGVQLFSSKNSGSFIASNLEYQINSKIKDERIKALGLDKSVFDRLDPQLQIDIKKISEEGIEEDNTMIATAIAGVVGFLNYIFVFIYGSLVLKGVHEEKQNRIVEIIVSSVRPFQLMFGKIIGIALVGLTQFLLWVAMIGIVTVIGFSIPGIDFNSPDSPVGKIFTGIESINFPFIVGMFLFYFVGGYFLYSSLFASIAAAVDNQADMQQFTLPVSLPLIFSVIALQAILQSPNSSLAVWLSIIPFTSPVIMMARLPFEVPVYQIVLSMFLLVAGFIFTTWVAARIYRVGILLHGSKVSYKDLWKWMFYK